MRQQLRSIVSEIQFFRVCRQSSLYVPNVSGVSGVIVL